MRIGSQEIQYLKAFETVSHAQAKDCLIGNEIITFVVPEGRMGHIIGKQGVNIKRLKSVLNKNIELVEFKKTAHGFLQTAFPSITFEGFETKNEQEKSILVAKMDHENKKRLLNDPRKVRRIKELLQRNYNLDDIQIEK